MTAVESVRSGRLPRPGFVPGWFRLAALATGGLAFGISAAVLFGGQLLPRGSDPGERPPLQIMLGQVHVIAPATLVRQSGVAGRLDLRVPLQASASGMDVRIAVTLTPATDSPAPDMRVASLYPRFFTADVGTGPAGLVRRNFRPGSPYAGEQVFFSPPDGKRFSARCESAGQDGAPPLCLAEFRRRGIDIQLRFPPSDVGAWEAMLASLLPRVEAMLH